MISANESVPTDKKLYEALTAGLKVDTYIHLGALSLALSNNGYVIGDGVCKESRKGLLALTEAGRVTKKRSHTQNLIFRPSKSLIQ